MSETPPAPQPANKVRYSGYLKRRKRSLSFWRQVLEDFNPPNNLSAQEIAERYINPKTGKHYRRESIYKILSRIESGEIAL